MPEQPHWQLPFEVWPGMIMTMTIRVTKSRNQQQQPSTIKTKTKKTKRITEEGATALGRAFLDNPSRRSNNLIVESLDLSNNPIGDRGALALAAALEQGKLSNLILRSCHIHAEGASSFGKALWTLTTTTSTQAEHEQEQIICLDLSGNPLGLLRGKSKSNKPDGTNNKYSAS